ncbi:hypothetical protein D3C71_1601810 [compost metagenome]
MLGSDALRAGVHLELAVGLLADLDAGDGLVGGQAEELHQGQRKQPRHTSQTHHRQPAQAADGPELEQAAAAFVARASPAQQHDKPGQQDDDGAQQYPDKRSDSVDQIRRPYGELRGWQPGAPGAPRACRGRLPSIEAAPQAPCFPSRST